MKCVILILALAAAARPQVADKANAHYRTPEERARMARNLSGSDRDARQKPSELVAALQLTPGMTVADLGTGVGYMLPYLSQAVGPVGHVVAEDIFPDFLAKAKAKAKKASLENVSFILGDEKDPKLPENNIDIALVLDAYHHFNYPDQMLAGIRRGLKKHGRLVVVDFYKSGFGDPDHVRLDKDGVIEEVEAQGFQLVSNRDHTPQRQYILTFRRK